MALDTLNECTFGSAWQYHYSENMSAMAPKPTRRYVSWRVLQTLREEEKEEETYVRKFCRCKNESKTYSTFNYFLSSEKDLVEEPRS